MELLAGLAFAIALQRTPPGPPDGRLSGVVVEEGTNLPVSGASVVFFPADAPPSPASHPPETKTDDEGRFAFDRVAPGRYRVGAHREDFALDLDESSLPVVDLGAGQDLTNVTIVLRHGGVIAGRVLDPSGQPLPGTATAVALVKRLDTIIASADPPLPNGMPLLLPLGQGETNARGEFRIERLPPGDYLVAVQAADGSSRAGPRVGTTYYPGTTDQSAAESVSVQSGRTVSDVTVRMVVVSTFLISGIVVDGDDVPTPSIGVWLMPDIRADSSLALFLIGPHGFTQTDADGRFSFDGIPDGAYTISVGESSDGLAAFSGNVAIDSTGALVGATNAATLPLSPGTVAISVDGSDVADVKIVVKKPR